METAVISPLTLLKHQQALYQNILTAENPEQIARTAIKWAYELLNVDRATVILLNFDKKKGELLLVNTHGSTALPEGFSINLSMLPFLNDLQQGKRAILRAPVLKKYAAESPPVASLYDEGIRFMACIPLFAQGELVGSFNLSLYDPEGLTAEEINIASELGTPIAIAIQQSRLWNESQQQTRALQKREYFLAFLTKMTTESIEIEDFQQMLQFLATNLKELFEADTCYITSLNATTDLINFLVVSGELQDQFQTMPPLSAEGTITKAILEQERVIAVNDATHSPFIRPDIAKQFNEASLLGIPLLSGGQKFGVILLAYKTPHPFSRDEIIQAEQSAIPLSLAVARADLLRQEREQRELAEALQDVGKILIATLDVDGVIERILTLIARVIPFDLATMLLVENGRVHQTRHKIKLDIREHGRSQKPQSQSIHVQKFNQIYVQAIIDSKQPIMHKMDQDTLPSEEAAHSWIGVPIIIQQEVTAVITVAKHKPNFYTNVHLDRLTAYAGQVALALHNAHLFDASQRQLEELSVLQALAVASTEALTEDQLLEQATQIIGDTLFPHNFGIILIDPSSQSLKPHPSYRIQREITHHESFPLTQGIVGHVASSKRPYRTGDTDNDPFYSAVDSETHSELCVPLLLNNKLIGVINTESKEYNGFSDSDEYLLITFARQLEIAIEKLRLFSETQQQAEDLRLVSRILRYLNATPEVSAIFPELNTNIKRLTKCTAVAIYLLDDKQNIQKAVTPKTNSPFPPLTNLNQTAASSNIRLGKIHQISNLQDEQTHQFEQALLGKQIQSTLSIPLFAGDQLLGFLTLVWAKTDGFNDISKASYQQVSVAIALAVQRNNLFREFKQWAQSLATLHELSRRLTSEVEVNQLCQTCAQQLNRQLNFYSVSVFLVDPDRQKIILYALEGPNKENVTTGEYSQNFGEGLVGLAAQTGKTIIANDAQNHPNFLSSQRIIVRSELVIPLRQTDQIIGLLNVDSEFKNAFNDNDLAILNIAADQLAAALGRAKSYEQTIQHAHTLEQRNRELLALNEVSQLLVATLDPHEIYKAIYRKIIEPIMAVPHFTVALYDSVKQMISCEFAITDHEESDVSQFPAFPYGEGLLSETIRTRKPRIINMVEELPKLQAKGRVVHVGDKRRPKTGLYVPLISGDKVIGVIYIQDYEENAFDSSDIRLLSTLASQASVAIEKSRLFKDTEARAAKLEALSALSTKMRMAKSVDKMLPLILQQAMSVVGGSLGSLYLLDIETGDLVCKGVHPPNPDLLGRRFKPGEGITGHIAATGEIHITENMAESKIARFYPEEEKMVAEEMIIRSGIGLPMQTSEKIIGVLYINLPDPHIFWPEEVEFLKAISEIGSSAINRMQILHSLEDRVNERTRALAEANEQLKELDQLKSQFISEVSHELRTPITNLGLYLDLIDHSSSDKHPHYLSILRKQTERLTHLIEDILSLSRVELGRDKIVLGPVNLNEIVRSIIDVQMPRVEDEGLSLDFLLAPNLPNIHGEPNQLSQVVSHLLVNAIEYTSEGAIYIETGFAETSQQIFLKVMDSGVGIDARDLPHLFERFYRGSHASQSNIPGTGLGLAIVKEVVDLHGGTIEVNGRDKKGTTFTIWLPIMKEGSEEK